MATLDDVDVTLEVIYHGHTINLSLYMEANGVRIILAHQSCIELDVEDDGTIMLPSIFEMLNYRQVYIKYLTDDEHMQEVWGKDSNEYKTWKSKHERGGDNK